VSGLKQRLYLFVELFGSEDANNPATNLSFTDNDHCHRQNVRDFEQSERFFIAEEDRIRNFQSLDSFPHLNGFIGRVRDADDLQAAARPTCEVSSETAVIVEPRSCGCSELADQATRRVFFGLQ